MEKNRRRLRMQTLVTQILARIFQVKISTF